MHAQDSQGPQNQDNNQAEGDFQILKVYVKDVSFESPKTPEIFKDDWQPEANIELNTNANKVEGGDDHYEVSLTITITAKTNEETTFLIEITQAGIFQIKGINDAEQTEHLLGSYCPSILFPYARETISGIVSRGGFPQLALAPINFDMLYAQNKQQAQNQQTQSQQEAN